MSSQQEQQEQLKEQQLKGYEEEKPVSEEVRVADDAAADEATIMNEIEKNIYITRDIETGDAYVQRLQDWRIALDELRDVIVAQASKEINECFEEEK